MSDYDELQNFSLFFASLFGALEGDSIASASIDARPKGGDLNGDGIADIAVSGLQRDSVHSLAGHEGGLPSNVSTADLDGTNGGTLQGPDGSSTGSAVSVCGDGSVIIGAPFENTGGNHHGAAFVVRAQLAFDANGTPIALADFDGGDGFKVVGAGDQDYLGSEVSGAGDINGDGFADWLFGVSNTDTRGSGSGSAYVVFNKAGPFAPAGDPVVAAGAGYPYRFEDRTAEAATYPWYRVVEYTAEGRGDVTPAFRAADLRSGSSRGRPRRGER